MTGVEITFNNFYEFAEWIHKTEKHREELEQDNYDLQKENLALRSELEQIKKATATNSDIENITTDNIPQIFKGREQ